MSLDYVVNMREWKMPEINENFWIAERLTDMSTIKVEPQDYVGLIKVRYDNKPLYERIKW